MRTHNLALMTVVFLVFGGLLSSLWLFGKSGFVEERAAAGAGFSAGAAFVQTAQGANLDASQVVAADNAAFSSLNSVSDPDATSVDKIAYPSGAVKDSVVYTSFSR